MPLNRLNMRRYFRKAGVALHLLSLSSAMLCGLTSACLISPKGPPVRGESANHAPHIVKATVQPQPDASGLIRVTCGSNQIDTDFQIATIVELDVEQTLYVSWFIDYDPDVNEINSRPFAEQKLEGEQGGAAERDVALSVRVPLNWLAPPTREGTHLVEVVVSDAEPLSVGELPYRSFPPGGLWDLYPWVILIDAEGCP